MQDNLNKDRSIPSKAMGIQFKRLIIEPLSDVQLGDEVRRLIVIIDALDECGDGKHVPGLLKLLVQAKQTGNVQLRLFITSRPDFHPNEGFSEVADESTLLVLDEADPTALKRDLESYIGFRFATIRQKSVFGLDCSWPENGSIKELAERAFPLFIFASTACNFVGEDTGNPRKRLSDLFRYYKSQKF